jgi:hypothetical protein
VSLDEGGYQTLGKNQLLSLLISVLLITVAIACHIHFWPVGTSLSVFTQLIFLDSFPAFFLGMVLYFTVKTVFAVPVCVVSSSGVETIAAWRCPLVLPPRLVLESVVPFVLESGDFIFFILGLRLAILIDGCHGSSGFGS